MVRIVFAGSPSVALPALRELANSSHNVVGVISQPSRPVGRKRVITATPVSLSAQEQGIPLVTPGPHEPLGPVLETFHADLAIAVAYGRLIDRESLALPRHGWWNLHYSLLPSWRGAAPVQHAILSGASLTGVSVFQMDSGLDTGDLLAQRTHPIGALTTAGQLLAELSEVGARLLVETVEILGRGALRPSAQTGAATAAPKLSRDDARLRWGVTAREVDCRFRACTPEPGAWTTVLGTERTLVITQAQPVPHHQHLGIGEVANHDGSVLVGCAGGAIELHQVTPSGGRSMSALEWWRGAGRGARFEP